MTYNYQIPKPTDIPKTNQPQFLSNFMSLNNQFGHDHIPFGNLAEGATLSNPCIITSLNHRLTTGNSITLSHFSGLGENDTPIAWTINGNTYVVTVIDENTFSIPEDTTTFLEYIPNSGDFSSTDYLYGYHQLLSFATAFPRAPDNFYQPDLNPPATSLWPGYIGGLGDLFFQNGRGNANEKQLNNIPIVQTNTGFGIRTPWGIIINSGRVQAIFGNTITYNFPIPYTSIIYTGIVTPFGNFIKGCTQSLRFPNLNSFIPQYGLPSPDFGGASVNMNYIVIGK